MRILLTGITGFVGSHMADYILKNVPDATIYAIRRWRSRIENIEHLFGNNRVIFKEADLVDRGSLQKLIRASKPDYVFHFAAQSFPETSFISPVHTLTTNIIGTTNLFEELYIAKKDGFCDPIIISVSSSEVYGNPLPSEVPMDENNMLRAANPYSISKVGHDFMSRYYYDAYNLKIITTRMFSHEGERRGREFALSSFAHQIVSHEKSIYKNDSYIIRVGNLDSVRTYSHISDAVHAYWLAATNGKIGEVYNIGGKDTCTVGEALENLLNKSYIKRDKFKIEIDPNRIRPTDITLQIPNCDKFKNDTGWNTVKTLDDITSDLLNFWRKKIN
jgi:GDP-mannose 4,6-dehydratase